ncbi:MAG: type II secretion system F family protein [Actinobacteria bacterium]|nr:type II secretion system F family protein [Actinomycetota bacterium]
MNLPLLAALAAVFVLGGTLLGVAGLQLRETAPPRTRVVRPVSRQDRVSKRTRRLVAGGATLGALVGVVTGMWAAVIILPALLVGLPYLLGGTGEKAAISRIEAIEEWVRTLAGSLSAGASLEQGLQTSLRSAPAPIRTEIATLVARISSRTGLARALRGFADDLDDVVGDKVVAVLLLASERRGAALAGVLDDLASSIADEVRARRVLEAERVKPRTTARWVTLIFVAVLTGLAFTGDFVAPYTAPLGQLVLVVLLACFGLILGLMRRMASTDRTARFVGAHISGRRPS